MLSNFLTRFDVASALFGASVALVLLLAILWPWIERQRRADARHPPWERVAPLVAAAPPAPRKMALVIRRADAPTVVRVATQPCLVGIPRGWRPDTFMADRAVCETDETVLQLLPYVVVLDRVSGRVLTYGRGKGGGEARLHALRSVGLGGHVDTPPNVYFKGPALMQHLQTEAKRELQEEAGLLVSALELEARGLIVDPTNPVGRVHLGILMTLDVKPHQLLNLRYEEGSIDDPRWMTIDELLERDKFDRLEPWSKVALGFLNLERGAMAQKAQA